ncbi:MAG: MFS transporter [Acidobacteriota bacterium]
MYGTMSTSGGGVEEPGAETRKLSFRLLLITSCGNILEWYDFAVYGYLTTVLARQFFPEQNPVAGVLATFGIFAVGFFGRIGGGLFYGLVSDRVGRVRALQLSVLLMAGSTTLMGLLPVYSQIGVLAPILLTVLRLLQGLSVGGEFATSMTVLSEQHSPGRRGWAASWCGAAGSTGFLLGAGAGACLSALLSPSALSSWGWRIPFLFGAVLGLVASVARRQLSAIDTKRLEPARARHIMTKVWHEQRGAMLITIGGACLYMVAFYVPFVYLATGIETHGHIPMSLALRLTTSALLLQVVLTPVGGWLADRVGARRLVTASCVGLAVFSPPLFELVQHGSVFGDAIVLLAFVILYTPINAVALMPLTMQFPREVRGTAFAVSFNLAAAVFGGLSPFAADWLVDRTGSLSSPGWMQVFAALVSLVAFYKCPDDRTRK